ncbi:unnamed protein product, partial [Prorocentrum cordatum]
MATTGGAAAASGEGKNAGGKIPVPIFDCTSKTMKKFREEVATWQIGTEVKPLNLGATLLASLKGKAEEAREELDLETIKGDDSAEVVLAYLGEHFPDLEHKFEETRDFNNRFNGIATKPPAKGIQVPDEVLADLYIKEARLPPERAASVLNAFGNTFNLTRIQEQPVINLPKVSVVDGNWDRHEKRGYGGHKKDHMKAYATEAYDDERRAEDRFDGASPHSSDEFDDDLPDELQDPDKLKEAKQARGYFAKRDGGPPQEKDDARITEMKARTHCGACGQKGHWRGDSQRPEKNGPNAMQDIPRKGSHTANLATHDGAGDAQEPRVAEMTVAAVYQQEQAGAARAGKQSTLQAIDQKTLRQATRIPEEVTAAHSHINKDTQCVMAATGSALIYIRGEELLRESGGKLTFDTARSQGAGDPDWHGDIRMKLAVFTICPIEYLEKEPFRLALTPCSVNGKAFTARVSIARGAVPGLFSRQAQSELDIVYHAGDNKTDIKAMNARDIQMGPSRARHPTLEVTGPTSSCKPVQDVSDTKTEIRLHPFATYHAETAAARPAQPAALERCDQGVDASEADESQSETDCSELDSAELTVRAA